MTPLTKPVQKLLRCVIATEDSVYQSITFIGSDNTVRGFFPLLHAGISMPLTSSTTVVSQSPSATERFHFLAITTMLY